MKFPGMNGLAAALLCWSGPSFAGTTANVGVVSEYLLRGIEGSHGIALQGGLDWSGASGVYLGTWASNLGGPEKVGDFEVDAYAGWAGKLGAVSLDLGAVYYSYPDDEQALDYDYPEAYVELGIGVLSLQLYYATDLYGEANEAAADLAGKDNDGLYVNVVATLPLSPAANLVVQAGRSSGEGVEVAYGDNYSDYSVAYTQSFKNGWLFSLGLYDATLEAGHDPEVVAGLKQTLEF